VLVVSSAVVNQPALAPGEVFVSASLLGPAGQVFSPSVVGGIVYPGISLDWTAPSGERLHWTAPEDFLHYTARGRLDYTAPDSRLLYSARGRLHWSPRPDD
jgi:hypothetical protein